MFFVVEDKDNKDNDTKTITETEIIQYLKVCHVLPDALPPRGGHSVPGPLLPLPLLRHDARRREVDGGPSKGCLHQKGNPLPGQTIPLAFTKVKVLYLPKKLAASETVCN